MAVERIWAVYSWEPLPDLRADVWIGPALGETVVESEENNYRSYITTALPEHLRGYPAGQVVARFASLRPILDADLRAAWEKEDDIKRGTWLFPHVGIVTCGLGVKLFYATGTHEDEMADERGGHARVEGVRYSAQVRGHKVDVEEARSRVLQLHRGGDHILKLVSAPTAEERDRLLVARMRSDRAKIGGWLAKDYARLDKVPARPEWVEAVLALSRRIYTNDDSDQRYSINQLTRR